MGNEKIEIASSEVKNTLIEQLISLIEHPSLKLQKFPECILVELILFYTCVLLLTVPTSCDNYVSATLCICICYI